MEGYGQKNNGQHGSSLLQFARKYCNRKTLGGKAAGLDAVRIFLRQQFHLGTKTKQIKTENIFSKTMQI